MNKILSKHTSLLACLAFVILAVFFLFWPGIADPDQTVWFSDGNVVAHKSHVEQIRALGGFFWGPTFYLGNGNETGRTFYPTWPIKASFPLGVSMWLNIALLIVWAGAGGYFCARVLGISSKGAIISGIGFGLTSHFVTLMGAGHLGKLQCIPWIPWVFGFFWQGWKSGKARHFLLAALCYSAMWLSGEPQVPYYLGLYLLLVSLLYLLYNGAKRKRDYLRPGSIRVLLSGICLMATIILSWQGMYKFGTRLVTEKPASAETPASDNGKESESDKYDFATSWSLPPEETATFLMTNRLFGQKSPEYWGRMGTKTFHMTQVGHYMGVLILCFGIAAVVVRIRRDKTTLFLLAVFLSSLVIAYGRFTPLYRLIYQLPTMSAQRIPSRWVALSAFAMCMLAGQGMDSFIGALRSPRNRKLWFWLPALSGVAGLLLLITWTFLNGSNLLTNVAFGQEGVLSATPREELAARRADLFLSAFRRTGWLFVATAAISGVAIWAANLQREKILSGKGVWLMLFCCAALLTIDLAENASKYIEFFDWKSFYREDALISFFKNDPDNFRIQPLGTQRHPYLNRFVTYKAPWFDLKLAEKAAQSRTKPELEKLFSRLSSGRNNYRFSPRYYDVFGIKYVLSAFELPANIRNVARLRLTRKLPFGRMPPLFLYSYTGYKNHPYFVSRSVEVEDINSMYDRVAAPGFDINSSVVGAGIPEIKEDGPGEARLVDFDGHTYKMTCKNESRGWLVLKAAYDPNWQATVDGKREQVHRVNALHCGILMEPGENQEVLLTYKPSRVHFYVTFYSWMIALIVLISWVLWIRKPGIINRLAQGPDVGRRA